MKLVSYLVLLFISGFWSSIVTSHTRDVLHSGPRLVDFKDSVRPGGRSLKSLSNYEDSTELVALLNGTINYKDKISGRVLWSFSSGAPIYSSYQAPLKQGNGKENASGPSTGFFVDYGDDWQLYAHFSGMKLPMNIEDFIKITPHISEEGEVILGSKRTTVFVVEAKTGRIARVYGSPDSPSVLQNGQENSSLDSDDKTYMDLVTSDLNDTTQVIYLTRTDYTLKTYVPSSDKVSWSIEVAVIEASFLCKNIEKNTSYELGSQVDSDYDSLVTCQPRRMSIRRQDKPHSSYRAFCPDDKLQLPGSNPILPPRHGVEVPLDKHHRRMMLPGSAPKSSIEPKSNVERIIALPNEPVGVDVHDSIVPYNGSFRFLFHWPSVVTFISILLGIGIYHFGLGSGGFSVKEQLTSASLRYSPSKRKKFRKSGKDNSVFEVTDMFISSENRDGFAASKGENNTLFDLNKVVDGSTDGRRIGKLHVSNTEIAKGSNGTVVLEGVYEGRPVAVKRLVQAHHDVAFKEIQNLIASDRHPNIVRWYGVEYDNDFVYLSLERCTCSLDDLIHASLDTSQNLLYRKDLDTRASTDYTLQVNSLECIMKDLNFWKANGYPSPQLLALMRDVVSGLLHLHELGIIHRDLKPQNVLIVRDRSLCAKLSDMGISKRLLGDMSSLSLHATGCGSSGWQAPEQLLHGRQTRAVDLFSLGCVLFFCITGGKHPFGDRLERDINIVKNRMDLFLLDCMPEAEDLISRLLKPDPELRPKALEVLHHPMFWNSEMRLSFLRDTSDRVELEDRESASDLLRTLESTAPTALGGKWNEKMEPAFINNIGHYRRYKYGSVRDLLRVMRNKLNHYRELPVKIQDLVGPVPEGYDNYFASRFPKLLIEVYRVVCRYCREEDCFQKYFRGSTL
ncbi:hypothetical protein K2173_004865 [Erythroxylum novogranatense]|uniref:non-specific serine/threonine protein kinase n=1 Tax=Erythroxylum novogranatense TaxID=1862640 RepID=A0AAV8TDB2_9ROSI|nr:hypothetical protein K2173_004865 [Erythroxylum novogranatense]